MIFTPDQIVQIMESSRSEAEWDKNCDLVKAAFGGDYPSFWFKAIIASNVAGRTMAKFDATPDIKVSTPEAGVHPHNW